MEGDVERIVELVRGLLETEAAIDLAYVFGSQARGTAQEGCDLGVALLGTEPFELGAIRRMEDTRQLHAMQQALLRERARR